MRPFTRIFPLGLFALGLHGCGSVPIDDQRSDSRLFKPTGVIEGTVLYQGPRPCSRNGHIVGTLIILVFDRRNPPPPGGLAATAINFGVVLGDRLFANEPRNPGSETYCPAENGFTETVSAGASFAISPMDAGSYMVQAFYDLKGEFLPSFKIRNLPRAGDLGGGYLDTEDAQKNASNPNYTPKFIPVDIGLPDSEPTDGSIPTFHIPSQGFVRDNVSVTVGQPLSLTRPYAWPEGAQFAAQTSGLTPVVTMPQDWHIPAPSFGNTNAAGYQARFKAITLNFGVPPEEVANAVDPKQPFHFQIQGGGFRQWKSGRLVPEQTTSDAIQIPDIWPQVVFSKLSELAAAADPQSLVAAGSSHEPIVIVQGLTLFDGSILSTLGTPATPSALKPTVTAMIRPSVLCFEADTTGTTEAEKVVLGIRRGGVLVTPFKQGEGGGGQQEDILNEAVVLANLAARGIKVTAIKYACLPTGKYAINVVYPTGQAWTLPNEAGSCASTEGTTDLINLSCPSKPRNILFSQGTQSVLEITTGTDCTGTRAVPPECLPR